MPTCPHCSHTWDAKPPKSKPLIGDLKPDTAAMSDDELRAYYKRTAPLEDVKFFASLQHLSPAVKAGARALAVAVYTLKIPRADVYRQLTALQNQWRRENYWGSVVVPAERIERRRLRAAERQQIRRVAA